jgi:hypothetical protein
MKKAWLDHVRDTREKNNRGKKTCSYREAMRLASTTWQDKKAKILRIQSRVSRGERRSKIASSRATDNKEPASKAGKLP